MTRDRSFARGIRAGVRRLFRLPIQSIDGARADADAELDAYIEARIEQLIARGMTPAEARSRALERLGGSVAEVRAMLRSSAEHREDRKRFRDWAGDIRDDVRYAVRGLARRPTLTATAALCFAIGIGANAAMFSVVDQLLLRPPIGVRDPASLAWIGITVRGGAEPPSSFSYQDYLDAARAPGAPQLAAYVAGISSFGRGTDERNIDVLIVTHAFLSVLGTTTSRGRFFAAADERPDAPRVIVLGYAFWQNQFAGRTDILGQIVRLGTTSYSIVGIAPPGFNGFERSRIDAYVPPTLFVDQLGAAWPLTERRLHWANMVARVEPGLRRQRLVAQLDAIYQNADAGDEHREDERIVAAEPGSRFTMGANAGRLKQVEVSLWLYGVATLVLLIACANVAALLLVRAAGRRREIAIRLAMGISRARLARLLMAESLVLAAIGCVLALALARVGAGLLRATLLSDLDPVGSFVDGRVVAVSLVTTLATGLACGLAPALLATRSDLVAALKTGERDGSPGGGRINSVLVVAQVALSLMLVIGASLFVGSVRTLSRLDLGFDARHLLRARLTAHATNARQADRYFRDVAQRVRELPGARAAALSSGGPFGAFTGQWLTIPGDGRIVPSPSAIFEVTPEYFEALGAPIVAGRNLLTTDGTGSDRVTVVNDLMARHYWPLGDALGKCIRPGGDTMPCATIVGIVRATREAAVPYELSGFSVPTEAFYVPFKTDLSSRVAHEATAWLYVRSVGDAPALVPAVRRVIETLAPDAPYPDVVAITERLATDYRPWQLGATMFTIFGGAALALAIVGLYGVLAFRVRERTHEIGVRMALGAERSDVQRWVVGQGLRLAMLGVSVGVGASVGLARFIDPLLYQTSARNPLVLGVAAGAFLIVALAASVVPALRAVRIDPMTALREL